MNKVALVLNHTCQTSQRKSPHRNKYTGVCRLHHETKSIYGHLYLLHTKLHCRVLWSLTYIKIKVAMTGFSIGDFILIFDDQGLSL